MGTAGMLFSMARLSGGNPHIGRRGAFVAHDLEALTVFADEPLPVQVDGDYLGTREKLVFTSTSRAVNVLI
jgi:diacylglycerol kinase family enzyme